MIYLRLLLVIALTFYYLEGAVAQESQNNSKETSYIVGMSTRQFVDEKRKNWDGTGSRPLNTTLWYPAVADSRTEILSIARVFVPLTITPDADISRRSDKYPLILLSHGTGGSAEMMMWLGHYLAGRGYIVAAVNHHGNTTAESRYAPQGFLLYWERPKDLTSVLDKMLADAVFGSRIDRNRIGAAGFSLGGYTVVSIAGGAFSQVEYDTFCSSPLRDFTCEPQREFPEAHTKFEAFKKSNAIVQESLKHAGDSYRDERIKGVFSIAPALGGGFTSIGLSGIKVPVHIVIGQADKVAPLTTNAKRYADLIKGAKLTVLYGDIGHYTFLAECNPFGKTVLNICRDAEGINRADVHKQVNELAFVFFEQIWAPQ